MPRGRSDLAYAVRISRQQIYEFGDQTIKNLGVFNTKDEAIRNASTCLGRTVGRPIGDFGRYFLEYAHNEQRGEITARSREGERFKVWIQPVDRRKIAPSTAITASTSAPVPIQAYIILLHTTRRQRDPKIQEPTKTEVLHDVYESLSDAKQRARQYLILNAFEGDGPEEGDDETWEEWMERYELVEKEENRSSTTLPYTGIRDEDWDSYADIVKIEVKPLEFVPTQPPYQRPESPSVSGSSEQSDDGSSERETSPELRRERARKRRRADRYDEYDEYEADGYWP